MIRDSITFRIQEMNETFMIPSNDTFTDQGYERIEAFHRVVKDECDELLEAIDDGEVKKIKLADCLADICVYCFSEARRWGIPLEEMIHIVLDSQESKLVDGKPVMAEDGSKFVKGPFYVAPEPKMEAFLEEWDAARKQ